MLKNQHSTNLRIDINSLVRPSAVEGCRATTQKFSWLLGSIDEPWVGREWGVRHTKSLRRVVEVQMHGIVWLLLAIWCPVCAITMFYELSAPEICAMPSMWTRYLRLKNWPAPYFKNLILSLMPCCVGTQAPESPPLPSTLSYLSPSSLCK